MTIENLKKGIEFSEKAKIAAVKMQEAINLAEELYEEIEEVEQQLNDYIYIDSHSFCHDTSLSLKSKETKYKTFKRGKGGFGNESEFSQKLIAFQLQIEQLGQLKSFLENKIEKQLNLKINNNFKVGDLVENHKPLKIVATGGGQETNINYSLLLHHSNYPSNLQIDTKFTILQIDNEKVILTHEKNRTETYRKNLLIAIKELHENFTVIESRNEINTDSKKITLNGVDYNFGGYIQQITLKDSKGKESLSDVFTYKYSDEKIDTYYPLNIETFLHDELEEIVEVTLDLYLIKGSWFRELKHTDGVVVTFKKNNAGEFKFNQKESKLQRQQLFLSKERTLQFN